MAITFDDGLASVAHTAAPLLVERGLTATVFCVAGYLGRTSDWPTHRSGRPVLPLAGARELEELVRAGFEIGSHGMEHAPLVGSDHVQLRHEVIGSRAALEQVLGVAVPSFAFPYGAGPSEAARSLVSETYSAACSARLGYVRRDADLVALPRVDAHYVRNPQRLRAALDGSLTTYLTARRVAARARRMVRKDYDLASNG